jgi:hypothetical protein
LFGEAAQLEPGLEKAKDRVARDHPDDMPFGGDRHLVDVLLLHAIENTDDGLVGRSAVDAIQRQHDGLN